MAELQGMLKKVLSVEGKLYIQRLGSTQKKVKSIGSGIIDSTLTIVFLFLITLKVNSLKNKKKSEMNDKENKNGRE